MTRQDSIWRYQALSDFETPSARTATMLESVRPIVDRLLARLNRGEEKNGDGADLDRFAPEELTELLPRWSAETTVEALAATLEEGGDLDESGGEVRVVVGPPGTRASETLAALARRRDWPELEPPPREDVASGSAAAEKCLAALADLKGPVVIPALHHWLVRSRRGLPFFRSLLVELHERPAPLIIGCDSWAWAFLNRALGVGGLADPPLALAALDARALSRWLGGPLEARGTTCREVGEENSRLFAGADDADADSPTLSKLATASRGNPGIALELWAGCLRRGSGESELRVAPPANGQAPVLTGLGLEHRFVLDTVLMHGGLEGDLLPVALPLPKARLSRSVRDLLDEKLLERTGDVLSVPLGSYGAARRYLADEGFLLDGF